MCVFVCARHRAPQQFAARVADFNENLLYQMQTTRGLGHLDLGADCNRGINELEKFLNANEYLGSFLSTESSWPQPPHVDYTWEILKEHEGDKSLMLGFFPLTKDGTLQNQATLRRMNDIIIRVSLSHRSDPSCTLAIIKVCFYKCGPPVVSTRILLPQ
jgi:hypothetical protein